MRIVISFVGHVGQQVLQSPMAPSDVAHFIQCSSDLRVVLSFCRHLESLSDQRGFFLVDDPFMVSAVTVAEGDLTKRSALKRILLVGQKCMLADAVTFLFRDGSKDVQNKSALFILRIDVFFFKNDVHTEFL